MTETTPPSPEGLQLRTTPLASARLSKKAVVTAVGALALILGFVIVNVSKSKPVKAAEQAASTKELQPSVNIGKELSKDIPDVIPLPPRQRDEAPAAGAPVKSLADDARLADTAVAKFVNVQHAEMQPAVAAMSEENPAEEATPGENTGITPGGGINTNTNFAAAGNPLRAAGGLLRVADQSSAAETDLNRQDEKEAFSKKTQRSAYLGNPLRAPLSPFELKTGTVIPGILVGAMNSDLPGEIVAQVSQNVYDTASGEHLLIPQGTRLYGRYDSNVSFGQGRLLVSWQRLIYPNAYTLELDAMSGHDQGGNSGFADQVNNHYARIFGWALLTSVISAGAQLSQPQETNVLTTPSSGQVAAAAVGQQMAQLGAQMAARNMQIQPTIQIRKGYRFTVMVNKDILFPGPYQP